MLACWWLEIYLVAFLGNSANQAIELLIQKGVPESHIIFLNLISVSNFLAVCKLITHFLTMSIYTNLYCVMLTSGPWGNTLCLQKVPILENCHLWDWCWTEWRIPCHTGYGWVWWSLFWYRWLISDSWNVKIVKATTRQKICMRHLYEFDSNQRCCYFSFYREFLLSNILVRIFNRA